MDWTQIIDWTTIAITLLSGTSLAGIVGFFIYRKENKELKKNEVKTSSVETQRKQIDLAEEYMKKVMEMSEMNYQATLKNGTDNANIIKKIDAIVAEQARLVAEQARLADELKDVKQEQSLEREFLNGAYGAFRQQKEEEARRKAAPARSKKPAPKQAKA